MTWRQSLARQLRKLADDLHPFGNTDVDLSRIGEGCVVANGVEYWSADSETRRRQEFHSRLAAERQRETARKAKVKIVKEVPMPPPKDAA